MKTEKPFSFQHVDRPPPGAGRTYWFWPVIEPIRLKESDFWIDWEDHYRQLAAERDANTHHANGGYAGNRFSWRSHLDTLAPLGLGLLIVTVLLYIMAARTLHHADGWRCHPGDRATTNGRELCSAHGVGR